MKKWSIRAKDIAVFSQNHTIRKLTYRKTLVISARMGEIHLDLRKFFQIVCITCIPKEFIFPALRALNCPKYRIFKNCPQIVII
jgi:hypothetical protein